MVYDAIDFLDGERIALAEDEGDEGPGIVLGEGSVSDQRRRKHKSTNAPADSIRRASWNDVMEARKVDRIAIGGWVTLCLLRADIGS